METVETTKSESLYANAAKHGLIYGAVMIVITILAYSISLPFMGSFKFLGCVLLIGIAYVIYAGITYRNSIGRYIGYGGAFQHGFIILAVGGLVNFFFGIILYQVIDPELGAKMTDVIIANTEETMRNFGAPEDAIDKALSDMRRDMPENFTLFGQVKGYFMTWIWYAIIVALTSLVVKKSEPVEM